MAICDGNDRSGLLRDEGSLARVSLVVITLDEEDNIERCISSAGGVGEIVVVDSFSGDRTAEIARALGAVVYEREFTTHADQKNWAMGKATGEWILILDADEALTPPLRSEIAAELVCPSAEGYRLRRRNEFLGRRIRFCGWGGDRVLRLFRRGSGSYAERAVHETLRLEGREADLKAPLDHRPYRDINDHIDRMRRYSRAGALELMKEGRGWFPGIFLNPFARFLRMYVIQFGFLDGMPGFILCSFAAINVFFKYAALRELLSKRGGRNETG